jgi:hypothetical protein
MCENYHGCDWRMIRSGSWLFRFLFSFAMMESTSNAAGAAREGARP